MKDTYATMGMQAVVEIADPEATLSDAQEVFDYFKSVDDRFSIYKKDSEITLWNEGKIQEGELSEEMKTVLHLCEETKKETNGFFDIKFKGEKDTTDPSGLVKGWAIRNGAEILRRRGFKNFYVEIGGDIEVEGVNKEGRKWAIGIRNPFKKEEIVKVVYLSGKGIATSGTATQGLHIYDPKNGKVADEVVSLTIIGPNIYEADRFATAAFAMGKSGINFIEKYSGLEGYMIDHQGMAIFTSGFDKFTEA
jgi:thiamine biosynthesis lipoprotein